MIRGAEPRGLEEPETLRTLISNEKLINKRMDVENVVKNVIGSGSMTFHFLGNLRWPSITRISKAVTEFMKSPKQREWVKSIRLTIVLK